MPAAENDAVVLSALGFANVTVPGPLTRLHVVDSCAGGDGSPSSVAVPASVVVAGSVMVRSAPALTDGARFAGG